METKQERSFWQRRGCILTIAGLILVLGLGFWIFLSVYQGRGLSRWTGIPVKVELPSCITSVDQVRSISFHKDSNGETIKDVTYVCDGRIFSREYNDFGILQGEVEWTLDR